MNNSTKLDTEEIKNFLKSSDHFQFKSVSKSERNEWIPALIRYHGYYKCARKTKGVLRDYMMKMTGISATQLTRLISEYKTRGTLEPKDEPIKRNTFKKTYTGEDIELIAKVDNANERLSAPATIQIFKDDFNISKKEEFVRLKNISPAHFYRLRESSKYREKARTFSKTKPTGVNIGERKKPQPDGKPGYLSVDTVHQGDKDKEKGVYHINIVDYATQFEFVGATCAISERFMEKILIHLLEKAPFKIVEFHSDNGSEYINKIISGMLNKLLINLTKSRPRRSNDNALVETKNAGLFGSNQKPHYT